MKTISGPKKTVSTPTASPRKTIAPRKSPVTTPQNARKQVASKGSVRKSATAAAAAAAVGSYTRKQTSSKNFATATKTPPRKTVSSKDIIARKMTPSKSIGGKTGARKTGKSPSKGGKGKKLRRDFTPEESDLSDEGGYSALEDVTDTSDDDDSEMEMEEEDHLTGIGETGPCLSTEDDNDLDDEEDDNDQELDDDENDIAIITESDDEFDAMEFKQGNVKQEDDDDHHHHHHDDEDDKDDKDEDLPEVSIEKDNGSVDGDIDENSSSSWNGVSGDDDQEEDASDDESEGDDAAGTTKIVHPKTESREEPDRKVRFDVSPSPSESTDTDEENYDELFPDIFISQNNLDPSFRQEIEDSDGSSSSGWDWHHDPYGAAPSIPALLPQNNAVQTQVSTGNAAFQEGIDIDIGNLDFEGALLNGTNLQGGDVVFDMAIEIPGITDASIMMANLAPAVSLFPQFDNQVDREEDINDGYESDGETTEEDEPAPVVRKRRHTGTPDATRTDSETDRPTPARRGQPRAAAFDLDRSDGKPIVVADPRTRKMMVFTPDKTQRQVDMSSGLFDTNAVMADPSVFDFFTSVAELPTLTQDELMNFDLGDIDFLPGPGPDDASAVLFGSLEPVMEVPEEDFDSDEMAADDESDAMFDMREYLCIGPESETEEDSHKNDDDDDDDDDDNDNDNDNDDDLDRTSNGQTAGSSTMYHVTPKDVGVFRRNQSDMQLINSNRATPDSLALSGPLHTSALKGIKSGRLAAGGVPLTPLRRRKISHDFASSPLDAISAKRKAISDLSVFEAAAAGTGHAYKRQRSISDATLAEFNV